MVAAITPTQHAPLASHLTHSRYFFHAARCKGARGCNLARSNSSTAGLWSAGARARPSLALVEPRSRQPMLPRARVTNIAGFAGAPLSPTSILDRSIGYTSRRRRLGLGLRIYTAYARARAHSVAALSCDPVEGVECARTLRDAPTCARGRCVDREVSRRALGRPETRRESNLEQGGVKAVDHEMRRETQRVTAVTTALAVLTYTGCMLLPGWLHVLVTA